jgi:hypothetical protein
MTMRAQCFVDGADGDFVTEVRDVPKVGDVIAHDGRRFVVIERPVRMADAGHRVLSRRDHDGALTTHVREIADHS